MPTAKQAKNALETIRQRVETEMSEESGTQEAEAVSQAPAEEARTSRKFNATTDDFFDYITKVVTPDEWTTGQTCLYVYKQARTGNEQLERLFRPVTFEEIRDTFVPKYGPGNYLLQFNTRLKAIGQASKRLTFDEKGSALDGASGTPYGANPYVGPMPGMAAAVESVSKMLENGAKTAVEVSKSAQMETAKGPDLAALVTAISGLVPKDSGTEKLLPVLLEVQKESAQAAQNQFTAILTMIQNQATQTLALIQAQNSAQLENLKASYGMMLQEKDRKQEDSLGMMGIMKDLFSSFVQDRFQNGAEPPARDWIGVLDKLTPAINNLAGPLAAKFAGMPMPPMMPPAPQLTHPNPHPSNGEARFQMPSTEQMVTIFAQTLAFYLHTHAQENYDLEHWVETAFRQYGPVAEIIGQVPKEQIIDILRRNSIGQEIFTAQGGAGGMFLDSLIDSIKEEIAGEDKAPQETAAADDKEPSRKPKAKQQAH